MGFMLPFSHMREKGNSMRTFILVMAMALLNSPVMSASPATNSKPPAIKQQKAPSQNPLDLYVNDIYRQQMSGKITPGQAQDMFNMKVDELMQTPDGMKVLQEFNSTLGQDD